MTAARHLQELHAVRLWDECMVHIAHVHLARGELAEANMRLQEAHESSRHRADLQIMRRAEAAIAQILLLRDDSREERHIHRPAYSPRPCVLPRIMFYFTVL